MTQSISRDQAASTQAKASKAALRERLLAARNGAGASAHAALAERVALALKELAPASLGFYWPMRGEADLRDIVAAWLADDPARSAALPVMADPRGESPMTGAASTPAPMTFHQWLPAAPMRVGRYGIAVPDDTPVLHPALLLVPCVGFDAHGYRLGYGGGYYDCTLASLTPRPQTIGIGFDATRVDTLPVETHDLPLDGIVTETTGYGIVGM